MKIRTITCHDVNNYGASLQAIALQTYLTQLGHDVKIIDYVPSYMDYSVWNVPSSSHLYTLARYSFLVRAFWALRTYLHFLPTLKRKESFSAFNKKYYSLTQRYRSFAELANNPPEADMYIAGSDQIWNTKLSNGKDPAFHLQFGLAHTRRASYAASFGLPEIKGGYSFLVKSYLSSFDAISVREASGLAILSKLGMSGTHVVDPVFLLSDKEWLKLLNIDKATRNKPYLLVYDLNKRVMQNEKRNFAAQYAKDYHLEVVAVNDKGETPYADVNINDAGPSEFVELLSNASFVLTDSFHATAFCHILHKPFHVYFDRPSAVRIKDFLEMVNTQSHMNGYAPSSDFDWIQIQKVLDVQIKQSKDYIHNILT